MRGAVVAAALIVIPITAAAQHGVGCGLPVVHAKAHDVLFLGALNTNPFRIVAWPVASGGAARVRLDLPGRLLQSQSGTGNTTWLASVDGSWLIHLFRLTREGDLVAAGKVRTVGRPGAFSWCEDGAGAAWILVSSFDRTERRVEAFRFERSGWTPKGRVASSNLQTPRAVPGSRDLIICGAWRFSARGAPRRIAVSGQDELAEIFPGRDGALTELRLDDLVVLTSNDSGAHWREAVAPWSSETRFDWPPEQIDRNGDAPMLRWVARGRVCVARYDGAKWSTILDAAVDDLRGMSGPAVMINGSLVFVGVCYRIVEGEADSFRVALIRNGQIQTKTIVVSYRAGS